MAFTRDWLEANPIDHTKFKAQPGHVRELKIDISDRIKNFFYGFTAGETTEGVKKLEFYVQGTAPSSAANKIVGFGSDVNSKCEKFYVDEDGNNIQITDGGRLKSKIVQVVNTQDGAVATGNTQMPIDDIIPKKTEGNEFMTLAITPKSATNKLKIDIVAHLASTSANAPMVAALFQDDITNALAASWMMSSANAGYGPSPIKFTHYMTAGTVSEITFKFQAGCHDALQTTFNGSGGGRLMGGVAASSITITEIEA